MQIQPLSIQHAILNREAYQDYQCQICSSIALKPSQCQGPCKKIFCTKCVSDWKLQKDFCPNKCSQPFFVKILETPRVQFMCPYNSNLCKLKIDSASNFQQHYQVCQYVPNKQKWLKQLKKNSKCLKQHDLEFFLGTYQQMCQSKCASCNENKVCRSICRKCDQMYCVNCRPPICCKNCCPLGHKFSYQETNYIGYMCDLCGISTSITNEGVYDDPLCNFGICQTCYNSLPENINKSINLKNPHKCDKNHELEIQLPQKQKKKCFNCYKQRFCPKYCTACKQEYCLDCKIGIIQQGMLCKFGHQISHVIQMPMSNTVHCCIKCEKQLTQDFYADEICQLFLCLVCFDYENAILDNKNRFIEQTNCAKGHILKFYSGEKEHIDQCVCCLKNKIIKLFCIYCKNDTGSYCCQCKELKQTELCYFGHTLQSFQSKQILNCHKCMVENKDFKKCYKCNYFICLNCYQKK